MNAMTKNKSPLARIFANQPRFKILFLSAALSGLNTAANAQVVVWSAPFDSEAVGLYGSTTQFGGTSSPLLNIVTPGMGGIGNAMALTWNQDGSFINFQSAGAS